MTSLQQAQDQREEAAGEPELVTNKLPGSYAALAAELWVASTVGRGMNSALGSVLGWRLEEAEDILDSELRLIKRRLARVGEVEQAAGMVLRYIRTAEEGASQTNLRIMAKIIRALVNKPRPRASDFLRFAEAVATLSFDEICAISCLAEKTRELDELGMTKDRDGKAWALTVDDLVPRLFADQQQVAEILLCASRTGLVTKSAPFKLGPFCTTPLLHELIELASLDRAIMEEGGE